MKYSNIIVFAILSALFLVSFFSIRNTALTFDETAHLPAGYSYLVKRDMRLNPEHPPLLKDLAGLPLLFIKDINFPDRPSWTEDINGQWKFGNQLLFQESNPADFMILAGRTMMILVLVAGGYLVYRFGKDFWGEKVGLIALLLYSLSPTLIAHGRLVTTDVGVAVVTLAVIYSFLKLLQEPNKKNVILAGVFLGIAQVVKFSAVFLVPYLLILWIIWTIKNKRSFWKQLGYLSLVFIIATSVVYVVYAYHVWGYPQERQVSDIRENLVHHPAKFMGPLLSNLSRIKILRPVTQYLYGVAMVFQRGVGGNTTYFMGQVTASGFRSYFPIMYLAKLPITFHILTMSAIILLIFKKKSTSVEWALISFIIFYWILTLSGNLNIGVRHLMPILPLIIILVARFTSELGWNILLPILLIQAISVFRFFPHFIPYYNELAGGPDNGHIIATDSNLDWGQDLIRLRDWMDNNSSRVYLDYFGGADREYYLQDRVLPWWGERDPNEIERPAYLAVSATLLQGGRAKPVRGFDRPANYYRWLDQEELVGKAGYSIFIYKID